MATVLLSAAIGGWLALSADGTVRSATLLLAGSASLLLAAALALRLPMGIPVSIVLLGAAYALRLLGSDDSLDGSAPIVAAGCYLLAELSYWSLELRGGIASEAGVYLRRIGLLSGLATGVVLFGLALLALVDVVGTSGIAVEALGAAAAVATLALLVLASRRSES